MTRKSPSRKRVHELAKEWAVPSRQILAQLEKIGIPGKSASSSLTQEEAEKVKQRLGLTPVPAPVVGKARLVSERVVEERAEGADQIVTTKEKVVESRVRTDVIRRRTTRVEVQQEPAAEEEREKQKEAPEITEPFAGPSPVAFESLPSPEPAATQVLPVTPPVQATPEKEEVRPRVLGRIDLSTVTAVPQPQKRPEPAPAPVVPLREKRGEQAGEKAAAEKRPPKRKSVHRSATLEIRESAGRLPRSRKKKKALLGREPQQTERTVPKARKRVIRIAEGISVGNLAKEMGVKGGEVITTLMGLGVMAPVNQVIDIDTATLVAAEFGHTVENVAFDAEALLAQEANVQARAEALPRAPVVTVMGHVDHGKTSLLDAIRHTNVTTREAGGITQHIGASEIEINGRRITFLDTPGHEAFTAMRARGAGVTDVAVLVVAADDGVMPQTLEAINHARAAQVPFIVALTKIDKPDANPDRVTRALANYGVVSEEWGGDILVVPVSAQTGEGILTLLDMILLQADLLELKAPLALPAKGAVVEAKLDKGRGPVATVLVREGVVKVGDPCVCGTQYGKVRALFNSRGERIPEATPATPVEVLGLGGVPGAGDPFAVTRDESQARQVAEHRQGKQREAALTAAKKFSLADLAHSSEKHKELRVVLKADVQGSVEALSEALQRLSTDEVKLTVLHASVGGISESDVLLASASHGMIIGFQVRPEAKATKLAEHEHIEIRLYSVIYEVLAEMREALEGLLSPVYKETSLGQFEVRQIFTIPRVGVIAGGLVKEGKMVRGAQVRLVRDQRVVYQGRLASLRRFKEDVREVAAGYECGVGLENFRDIKDGDVVEAFETEQIARRLEPRPPEPELRLSA